ncbi:type I glyceraldehyde-3-phosphate dehydrogenase [Candidatus Legionella polyplacis]|uniref:Glyceraldehyde-3-phosphate dehydrogenase n=1 Tax=Candidatus Legionella polyplacis TaxID=2005262 RepID=A0ABZ2GZ78_9GAMM
MIRIAINGYGRIGRCILRTIFESKKEHKFNIIAINDLTNIKTIAHLTKYDSTHGKFKYPINFNHKHLLIKNHAIIFFSEKNPINLPWKSLNIDLVFECTGLFTNKKQAKQHLLAGAKKVIISAPSNTADATIVYGVNHKKIKSTNNIISNASCTTNCLAILIKPLHKFIGIQKGLVNTIHSYTQDQHLIDNIHNDLCRARSATQSIIPTKTNAIKTIDLILPELSGKLDGLSMRVPTLNVSAIDLTFISKKNTCINEIHDIMYKAKNNILHITQEPLVSCDYNHSSASAIFDTTQTKVIKNLIKIVAWYDNEWGFSNRMIDTGNYLFKLIKN